MQIQKNRIVNIISADTDPHLLAIHFNILGLIDPAFGSDAIDRFTDIDNSE